MNRTSKGARTALSAEFGFAPLAEKAVRALKTFFRESLFLSLAILSSSLVRAAEPWADERLALTNHLEIWLDASRQNAARGTLQLPTLASGNSVDYLLDGSGRRRHLSQPRAESRPRFRQEFTGAFLSFDGQDNALFGSLLRASFSNATVFVVAAPRTNAGSFRGFFGASQAGRNDYVTGLNFDLGPWPTPRLTFLNAEGSGFGGALNLMQRVSSDFGRWHLFTLSCGEGSNGVRLFLDNEPLGTRARNEALLRIDTFVLGARHYSNAAEPPHAQGFFAGEIAEVLFYDCTLGDPERGVVEKYLRSKYAKFLSLTPEVTGGAKPLVAVTNPPPVQMLVPGFNVRPLPVSLPNINNVKYRRDGKLVAVGYNGRVWLLSDSDGDGLEDKAEPFWDRETIRAPIGLALTPPGYPRGQGVFLPGKGKLSLIVDTNADDRADEEIVVATWPEPSQQHGVDALGVALDKDGNVYFGLGTASFTGAYLIDKTTGEAGYNLKSERGTILKVSPDFQHREIVCTGIRFPVSLAFNAAGDLFCTDQEGATWLPNGNPLDELLHIQPGRHYGFPPRHPKHLPDVIDEPSVFDYAPQHQSICGLNFNEPISLSVESLNRSTVPSTTSTTQRSFGPSWWAGDAIVAGYSRGKLFRTKLVKTAAGYVAQSQLFACLSSLTVDACVSPDGALVVSTHSGQPDWGSGPTGMGKLYQIRYSPQRAPEPVMAWSTSPTEIRVAFDHELETTRLRGLTRQSTITQGKYVSAGDRFETIRPGYQVVYDQLAMPRFDVPILSARLSADHRTLILVTPPRNAAVNYALTLPNFITDSSAIDVSAKTFVAPALGSGAPGSFDETELLMDLNGVAASWRSEDGTENWEGWFPHPDIEVARVFTQNSTEHDRLWALLSKPGTLRLRGQLDLWQMLQPAIQPGAKLDYERPLESVTVTFSGSVWPESKFASTGPRMPLSSSANEVRFTRKGRENDWLPFSLVVPTGLSQPRVCSTWSTAADPRPRPFPLRRFLLPWARADSAAPPQAADRNIPEIAGGDWLRGKRIFFGENIACSKCHRIRGEGGDVGPNLSNLVYRDYASVLKDIREPNAAMNPDHVAYEVELMDGEALTAVLKNDARDQLTFADASGRTISVPRPKLMSLRASKVSLMPEGLLQALSSEQLRDLMTFLLTMPLEPAAIEAPNPPPARGPTELASIRGFGVPQLPMADGKWQIVLCAGPKDHGPGEHDYPLWQKRWEKLLALAEGVKVSTAEKWPSSEQLASADVIVFYSNNPVWDAARAQELDAFLGRGRGVVYLHWAVEGQKHVEELAERIGLAWRDGVSKFRHGALDLTLHSHPLALGVGKLKLVDESYWNLVGDAKGVDVIASGEEEGELRPLLWTRNQGRGRVFVSIPGHYTWTFDDPLFRTLLLRGICWAGGQPLDRLAGLATIGARMTE
jgi:putative heme-binding domain-containing protein